MSPSPPNKTGVLPQKPRHARYLLLSALLAGAVLRLMLVHQQGYQMDHSSYTWFASYYWDMLTGATKVGWVTFDDLGKPGYMLISTIAVALFGVSSSTLQITGALFGLGNIVLCYRIGKQLGSEYAGYAAAAFAAVLPMAVELDRSGYAHTCATFFILVGLHQLLKYIATGNGRSFYWAGASSGMAVLCHPTTAVYAALLYALGLASTFFKRKGRFPVRFSLAATVCFALPVLLAEGAYRAIYLLAPPLARRSDFVLGPGYLSDLLHHYGISAWQKGNSVLYFATFIAEDVRWGWLAAALILLNLAALGYFLLRLARRFDWEHMTVAVVMLVPLASWALNTTVDQQVRFILPSYLLAGVAMALLLVGPNRPAWTRRGAARTLFARFLLAAVLIGCANLSAVSVAARVDAGHEEDLIKAIHTAGLDNIVVGGSYKPRYWDLLMEQYLCCTPLYDICRSRYGRNPKDLEAVVRKNNAAAIVHLVYKKGKPAAALDQSFLELFLRLGFLPRTDLSFESEAFHVQVYDRRSNPLQAPGMASLPAP